MYLELRMTDFSQYSRLLPQLIWQFTYVAFKDYDSKIGLFLRQKLLHTKCYIDTSVIIKNPANFLSGEGSALYHSTYILNPQGIFSIGNDSHLGAFCFVNVAFGQVKIGNHVAIGPGTKIFAYSNHYEKGKKVTDLRITQDVSLGNNILIGANSTLLPGVIIHDNVVVGAGSVVKGELQANKVYAGNPCKPIREAWYE